MGKVELYNDKFQNYGNYNIPKAQLILADIPYNLGGDAYASSTKWYVDGDNKNGRSEKADTAFFKTDIDFKVGDFMCFCSEVLMDEPKEKGKAPAVVVFCAFEQIFDVIECGKMYGFKNYYPLFFIKDYSPQSLKANMKIVGATEYAIVLYRNKLPKFNNGRKIGDDGKPIRGTGKMIFNWFKWERDSKDISRVHPTQKPIKVLKRLIEIFTDEGDIVIDPCAGSGSTLRACKELNRDCYGFEIESDFYEAATKVTLN